MKNSELTKYNMWKNIPDWVTDIEEYLIIVKLNILINKKGQWP